MALVQPVRPIIARELDSLVVLHIDVDRDAGDSRLVGHEHEPASLILNEIEEIVLAVYFKLQFLFSLVTQNRDAGGSSETPALRKTF